MEILKTAVDWLTALTPAQACQAFYVFASVTILALNILPPDLRTALMDYGARRQGSEGKKQQSFLKGLINCVQVPHSWFLHFYVLSVGWSAFWMWQYLTRGAIMEGLARAQIHNEGESMDISQVFLAWGLMALQGLRRLYESIFVTKPGRSPMSSIHWLVGLVYYTAMSVSVWIEGSGAILNCWDAADSPLHMSPTAALAVGLVFIGWTKQNKCHKHLASLKKYTLPGQDWFKYIVCPHYTSECLIYLGISIAAAPPGQIVSRTVFLGLVFVAVNLGATAGTTKRWYAQKFGADKVAAKWKMIPFVF